MLKHLTTGLDRNSNAPRLLLQALRSPPSVLAFDLADWDALLPLLRRLNMLGQLQQRLAERGLLQRLPERLAVHLDAAALIAVEHARRMRWEVNRIEHALRGVVEPLVLLKGAAYVLADLPCARGRLAGDVDILVPADRLTAVEQALLSKNWSPVIDNDYDQQYYRRWAHELPPLRHTLRGTTIDVHHTILPITARLRPDPALLLAAARPLPASAAVANVKVLAPPDMVLHSAAHAFYDGDFTQVLRDLWDLHELLSGFGGGSGGGEFWAELPRRAVELDLQRPLFYALRFCQRFFATPVPPTVGAALAAGGFVPPRPALAVMDRLAERAVYCPTATSFAHWVLYMRAFWLRMPPPLLARHLATKAWRRLRFKTLPTTKVPVAKTE